MNRSIWLILVLSTCFTGFSSAQDNDIVVGETQFPEKVWGKQNLSFDITNNAEWPVYVTIETEVVFEDIDKNAVPPVYSHFILMPGIATTVTPEAEIPANYGRLTLWLRVHEVVDTLDDVSAGELVFKQPFKLMFYTSEELTEYFKVPIKLPPLVDKSALFGNDFTNLFLLLIEEGRSIEEIVKLSKTTDRFVQTLAGDLMDQRYILKTQEGYQPGLPIVNLKEARAVRSYIDTVSFELAKIIQDNRPAFRNTRDSLIKAKTLSPDSEYFYGGGAPLWKPYPMILGMTLWRDLGRRFFARDLSVNIYGNSNPCDARIKQYMYLVKGGSYFNGSSYFNYHSSRNRTGFDVSATMPSFICTPVNSSRGGQAKIDWKYAQGSNPEAFLYDTLVIKPAVAVLSHNCGEFLDRFDEHLNLILTDYGHDTSMPGIRLWIWNLMVTRTISTMEKEGWLTKFGNGHYRFIQKD